MSCSLYIDFGASRVKFALINSQGIMKDSFTTQSPLAVYTENNCYELNPETYWCILSNGITDIQNKFGEKIINSIYLCSEMHGFLLLDENNQPYTNYISWKDQRSSNPFGTASYFDILKSEVHNFRKKTGMHLKHGLPFVNLWCFVKENKLKKDNLRFCTLIDWLLIRGGETNPKANITLAAGTGFININTQEWDQDLIDFIFKNNSIHFSKLVTSCNALLGTITLNTKKINIYAGTGDMQTALYGANIRNDKDILINLGTGSQVICAGNDESHNYEIRLGCSGQTYRTITHIPSGRMLSIFAKLFTVCDKNGIQSFWEGWNNLTSAEVLNAPPIFDCRIFSSAWGYTEHSGVFIISENIINYNLIASLAHSWLQQYHKAILLLDTENTFSHILLSGGLARKGKFIEQTLESITKKDIHIIQPVYEEETIDGLFNLTI